MDNGKLKYRHLSEDAKDLGRKLVLANKNKEINRAFDMSFFFGGGEIVGVMVWGNGNENIINEDNLFALEELASENLVVLIEISLEKRRVQLNTALFDAVAENFNILEPQPASYNTFNINAPTEQLAIHTGSGGINQAKTIQATATDIRQLLTKLNIDDEEINSLLDKVESNPTDNSVRLLSSKVAYKAMEILSNTGGAGAALAAVYQIVKSLI
jgi:UDP-N-acetylglucosamine 2-epimerase